MFWLLHSHRRWGDQCALHIHHGSEVVGVGNCLSRMKETSFVARFKPTPFV